MKHAFLFGSAIALALAAGAASGATLDDVKARGTLKCGVNTGLAGFAAPDASGQWEGFDIAVLPRARRRGPRRPDEGRVHAADRRDPLHRAASGEIDVLSRNSTWTFSRDVDLKFTFAGVNYYDGQGFMVPKDLGVTSAMELDGATVCIQTGTTTELNLADWFKANGITYQPVPIQTNAEADQQFQAGACDAYTTDASGLAASRATYENPENWIILPEIISKEPLGPLVRQGDDQWADIARWTLNALIAAEEYGVTAANAEEMAATSENPEIKRLLGSEGDLGAMFGLDKDWAVRAIKARGNYGEIFAANIGEGTASNIARGLNAQWTDGGLIFSPPFR